MSVLMLLVAQLLCVSVDLGLNMSTDADYHCLCIEFVRSDRSGSLVYYRIVCLLMSCRAQFVVSMFYPT
jgi:hypothetical protein